MIKYVILLFSAIILINGLYYDKELIYKKLKYISMFADPQRGIENKADSHLDACIQTNEMEYRYMRHLDDKMKILSSKRRIGIIFLTILILLSCVITFMVHATEYSAQQIETLKQFRSIVEFRRRFSECINNLERKLGIEEIDFTFRSRCFIYPEDVMVPPHMQLDDGPLPAKQNKVPNVAFPHLSQDEDENLEGRTDYHAIERSAGNLVLIAISKTKINILWFLGIFATIVTVFLTVTWIYGANIDMTVLVELCQIESDVHEKECLPFLNPYIQEQLEIYLSWERGLAAERVYGIGFISTGVIISSFVMLAQFLHGSRQLCDSSSKSILHIPNSLFSVYLAAFVLTTLMNFALLALIFTESQKTSTILNSLEHCTKELNLHYIDTLSDNFSTF